MRHPLTQRLGGLLLLCIVILGAGCATPPQAESNGSIPSGQWRVDVVDYSVVQGVASGSDWGVIYPAPSGKRWLILKLIIQNDATRARALGASQAAFTLKTPEAAEERPTKLPIQRPLTLPKSFAPHQSVTGDLLFELAPEFDPHDLRLVFRYSRSGQGTDQIVFAPLHRPADAAG